MQHTNRAGSIHSSEEQMEPKEMEDNTVGSKKIYHADKR